MAGVFSMLVATGAVALRSDVPREHKGVRHRGPSWEQEGVHRRGPHRESPGRLVAAGTVTLAPGRPVAAEHLGPTQRMIEGLKVARPPGPPRRKGLPLCLAYFCLFLSLFFCTLLGPPSAKLEPLNGECSSSTYSSSTYSSTGVAFFATCLRKYSNHVINSPPAGSMLAGSFCHGSQRERTQMQE